MNALPLRVKIALLSAGISGAVLLGFGMFTWLLVYDLRIAAVDREIKSVGSRHPGLFSRRGSYDRLAASLESTFGPDYARKVIVIVEDAGNRVYRSPHWPKEIGDLPELATNGVAGVSVTRGTNAPDEAALDFSPGRGRGFGQGQGRGGPPPAVIFSAPPQFRTLRADGTSWRIGLLTVQQTRLAVGLNLDEVHHEMDHLRRTFVWTLPLAFLVVGVGGWLVAGRALKPLRAIAETARKVTATGLDQRIPQSHESPEIRRVIEMLNHMMDRLEKSFRQATRFSADASHELKTPLAIMQGELENALQSAPPGSSEQQLCNTLLEEVQRLKTITRSLLLLAQADAGQLKLAVDDVNLSAEVEGLLEDAKVLAGDKRLSFEETIPANVVAQGDRALLRTAMLNLVSNAVKYADPGGRVKVALALEDGQLVLSIGNTGSGIPPEETPRLFSRFHRVHREGEAWVEGMGLGLSLAREIARAHRGDVVLKESRAGWTCFELRLPGVSTVGRGSGATGD